jgi:hypothetical protein
LVGQAETVHQWYRTGIDISLSDGTSHVAGYHVGQRNTATLHIEVEGLTTQVWNVTHFHVSFLFFASFSRVDTA